MRSPFRGEWRVKGVFILPRIRSLSEPVLIVLLSWASAGQGSGAASNSARPLSIQGAPATTAQPDSFYSFTPTVLQRGDKDLRFTVENKPAWLSLGTRHGTLYGTPHAVHAGTYSNIVITVSDGRTTARLPPFSIEVPAPPGPVVANWEIAAARKAWADSAALRGAYSPSK